MPGGALNETLTYEEVADVCSRLKLGVSGVSIDYKHILSGNVYFRPAEFMKEAGNVFSHAS